MSHAEHNGGSWEVHCSGAVAKRLRAVQRQATKEGRGEAVLDAFRQIVQRLQQDPSGVGEPLYHLPALHMEVRSVVVRPLSVHFGVCSDRPLVFIKGVELLSE